MAYVSRILSGVLAGLPRVLPIALGPRCLHAAVNTFDSLMVDMAYGTRLKQAQVATWLIVSNVDALEREGGEMMKDEGVTLASSGCR
jgi:hypothetical protein